MVEQYQKQFESFITSIDKELESYSAAQELEKATGVKKSYFAIGGAAFVIILIFFNIAGQLLSNLVTGSLLLTYDPQKVAEHFSDFLLYWIPFYFFFKTIFVVWLYLPQTRGAEVLYTKFVKPTLSPYIAKGQAFAAQAKAAATHVADGIKKD
ncbi:ER membrane protein DP1/Yop1 [Gonapodya sp. JEL0774]|nr:ER membrane protein DP1/Yop1 [Gonapodya sp. JEL0774]